MADSSVAITAGSGTSIDTRTEATNGQHRQVVVLGDPSVNAGVAPVDATNGLAVDAKTLPPGAATSANQTTANSSLSSIDTKLSGTLTTSGTNTVTGNVADAGTDSGNPVKVGGRYNSTRPTYTDGQRGDLQLGTRGSLGVTLFSPDSVNAFGANADNADGVATSATANGLKAMSRNTVYNGTTWDRMPGTTTGVSVVPKPSISGGYTIYRNLDVQSTGVNVKASAGQVYGWYIANLASSVRYVKLYNKATTPTVGTDAPVLTIAIPANGAANVEYEIGIAFATGIGIGGVTGVADNSTGAPTANDIICNLLYN